ncbi:MAG: UvrD-helicase domain-containing protein [Bacteroidota bacterium]
MQPKFKIYSSSAGSGKTYTLTKEYLKLALKTDSPFYFRRILAITFTNDAANEMKERILQALRNFSDDSDLSEKEKAKSDAFLAEVMQEMNEFGNPSGAFDTVTEEILRLRAGQTYKKIIHEYADFAVCTIDSFVNRIVSAFTEELNIPFNYEVDMDTQTLLNAAVERLLDKVGREEYSQLTEAMEAYAQEKAEEGRNWNQLPDELASFGRNLFNEQVFSSVSKVQDLNVLDFMRIREQLTRHNAEVERCLRVKAQQAIQLIAANGLTNKDFYYGDKGIAAFFGKWNGTKMYFADTPNSYVRKTIEEDIWYTGKSTQREVIDLIKSELAECFHCIENIRGETGAKYSLFQQLLPAFYKLSVLNQLKQELREIQRDKNTIHISDFNKTILDIVLREPVPFIYERMGERYNHILIDEFQDTSVLQWTNLLPLIENSLGSAHFNMAVGDAKQAIYRWRGGEMEQIVHLYQQQPDQLMAMNRTHNELVEERYFGISQYLTPAQLRTNYRSTQEIIAFNNAFFRAVADFSHFDRPLLASIYDADFEQELPAEPKVGGHVQISFLDKVEGPEEEIFYEQVMMQAVLQTIEEAERAGYEWTDIAILSRKNQEGKDIANFLKEHGYDIISQDSLSLQFSDAVNLLVALLKVVHNPENKLAKYEALYLFSRIIVREIPDNVVNEHIRTVVESGEPQLFYDYFVDKGFFIEAFRLQQIGIYEITEKLIDTFQLFAKARQAEYLFRFLDVVLEFSTKQSNQLADFMAYWEQKKDKLSINTPRNRRAITLTSIHRAKGLEYPVVIIPFADWSLTPMRNAAMWVDLEDIQYDELTLLSDDEHTLDKRLSSSSVSIISALGDTPLQEQYQREMERTYIESLNMLYVAMTRSINRLYVLAKRNDFTKANYRNGVSYLFYRFLQEKELWKEDTCTYVWCEGAEKPPKTESLPDENILELTHIISHDKTDSARLSRSASRLFDLDTFEKKKDWGHKLYDAISRLRHAGELDKVLRMLVSEGMIDKTESAQLRTQIQQLISLPELKAFFEEGLRVDLCREILLRGKEVLKPDRVVWKGSRIIIFDYKTGSPELWHRDAMEKYEESFTKMGFQQIEKWLVYLEDGKVIPV